MKERVLGLDLAGTIDAFVGMKWKFFCETEKELQVKVEVPRGWGEQYVVELTFGTEKEVEEAKKKLVDAGFKSQMVRFVHDWEY